MSRSLLLGDQYAWLSTPRPGGKLVCTAAMLRCSKLATDDIHVGREATAAPDDQDWDSSQCCTSNEPELRAKRRERCAASVT